MLIIFNKYFNLTLAVDISSKNDQFTSYDNLLLSFVLSFKWVIFILN